MIIYKNIYKSSILVRVVVLGILLFFNSFHAQDQNPTTDGKSCAVFLIQGAKVYSADPNFNKQVDQGKVIVEKGDIFLEQTADSRGVLIVSACYSKTPNFAQQVKLSEKNKKKELLKEIKNKIDHYEVQSKSFEKKNYQNLPSPFQFFSSHSTSQDYIVPSHTSNDLSKIFIEAKKYSVNRALDYLHTQKYEYYNNKSLAFCFSEVFSARPPPVLIL